MHDIRAKLEREKRFEKVQVNALLEDTLGRHHGVDVIAMTKDEELIRCYFVETLETDKYLSGMKHKAIEIQNAFPDSNIEFYIVTPKGTKKYNAGN
jgi:hypothetical protein